jgi:hypothetical protein
MVIRAQICKLLRSPGIDSKESILPTYVAWQACKTKRVMRPKFTKIAIRAKQKFYSKIQYGYRKTQNFMHFFTFINNFFWCLLKQLFQRIRNQREILRFLISFLKEKKFWGHIRTF